jgi:hypothetical protein
MDKEKIMKQLSKEEGTMKDLIDFNKKFYQKRGYVTKRLGECKKCEHNKGMHENFVRCNHLIKFIALVISQPCFYEEGFKNGERVVHCPKER